MLEGLEALEFLERLGTMTAVANRLRLTQPTVTKRIQALEKLVGRKLTQSQGRHVKLTEAGRKLIERSSPLIQELKSAVADESSEEKKQTTTLAVSESALASWVPEALIKVQKKNPELEFILHAHSSLTAIEKVRRGECVAAICTGLAENVPGLHAEKLFDEEFAFVASKLDMDSVPKQGEIPVMCIEEHSATWRHIEAYLGQGKTQYRIDRRLESFFCLIPMAVAGFGHAIVPISLVKAAKLPEKSYKVLKGFTRPVSLVARKNSLSRASLSKLLKALRG